MKRKSLKEDLIKSRKEIKDKDSENNGSRERSRDKDNQKSSKSEYSESNEDKYSSEKIVNNIELTSKESHFEKNFKDSENLIKLEKEKLLPLLKCPICKGFYRTPYTINECLHTFCKNCIFEHFLTSNQREDCPVCNTKIGGRPIDSLIFDNKLDSLINILFPEFDELDKKNIKMMYDAFREDGQPLPGDEEEAKKKEPNIKISIKPENKENKFSGTFLVPKNFNIQSLKQLIHERCKNISDVETLSIKYKNNELLNDYTMDYIDDTFGLSQDKSFLYYSIKKPEPDTDILKDVQV